MWKAAPNDRRVTSLLSVSSQQSLLSDSQISRQLPATLLRLPAAGSARFLVRKRPGPLCLLRVWQRSEGSFLRTLCLVSKLDLCAAEAPSDHPLPFPLHPGKSCPGNGWFSSFLAPTNLSSCNQSGEAGISWHLLQYLYPCQLEADEFVRENSL